MKDRSHTTRSQSSARGSNSDESNTSKMGAKKGANKSGKAAKTAPKQQISRRVLANRKSAQKSRLLRIQMCSALERVVESLSTETENLAPQLQQWSQKYTNLLSENARLTTAYNSLLQASSTRASGAPPSSPGTPLSCNSDNTLRSLGSMENAGLLPLHQTLRAPLPNLITSASTAGIPAVWTKAPVKPGAQWDLPSVPQQPVPPRLSNLPSGLPNQGLFKGQHCGLHSGQGPSGYPAGDRFSELRSSPLFQQHGPAWATLAGSHSSAPQETNICNPASMSAPMFENPSCSQQEYVREAYRFLTSHPTDATQGPCNSSTMSTSRFAMPSNIFSRQSGMPQQHNILQIKALQQQSQQSQEAWQLSTLPMPGNTSPPATSVDMHAMLDVREQMQVSPAEDDDLEGLLLYEGIMDSHDFAKHEM